MAEERITLTRWREAPLGHGPSRWEEWTQDDPPVRPEVEVAEFVPLADLQAAQEERDRLREALERIEGLTHEARMGGVIPAIRQLARSALAQHPDEAKGSDG